MSTPFFGTLTITSNDSGSPLIVQLSASAEPVVSNPPVYRLDTTCLVNLTQWTVNKTGYAYGPAKTAPNPITNILLWKVDDVDNPDVSRTLMTNFSSSMFTDGDILDVSMWITASAPNSAYFFTVLGGSGSVLMEIPTEMKAVWQTGSIVFGNFYVNATASVPPNDTHPQMELFIFSSTSSINQCYGMQFQNPASSSAIFYLSRRVEDQQET
jgi:hypothetical protein